MKFDDQPRTTDNPGHAGSLPPGAVLRDDGRAQFSIWAPDADEAWVELAGMAEIPMREGPAGCFSADASVHAGARYRYQLRGKRIAEAGSGEAGEITVPDPASRGQDGDVHDYSILLDPAGYEWRHRDWQGRPWHEAIIYEVHVGAFGGFDGLASRLPELAALGVTAIELMPIADFPGTRNWGYDGVLPFAPDASYGSPESLKHLVDTAHGLGLMMFLDVVYNHFGPDGNYLGAYASPVYRTDQKTPWGDAIDFRRPEVREFFTGNAVYWLNEYRFDGLRLDAVHMIRDAGFLRQFAAEVRSRVASGRHVHLVIENEDNAAGLLRGDPAAPGFDAQWADDLHHCLHVMLTGESEAYYEDFSDAPAEKLARCLAEGFAYQGQASRHAGGTPRGEPSGHLPPTAFVICLQNHDQIGNRAMGERIVSLADPESMRAAVALLLLVPQIPLLFMGEEWGSTRPFLYFTSHSEELGELVRQGRRQEFAKFAAFADPARRERIPDPNAPETFEASRVDFTEAQAPENARWRQFYQGLLEIRTGEVVPRIPGARSEGAAAVGEASVVARWRMGDGARLSIASNLGSDAVSIDALSGRILFASSAGAAEEVARGKLLPRSTVAMLEDAGR